MYRKGFYALAAMAVIVAGLGAFLALLDTSSADSRAMILPVDPVPLVVETTGGERSFHIEVADSLDERTRGLMFREDMPADRGMLFVFEQTQPLGFWMKNTPMALDLLFIGQDGRVKDILPGEPYSEAVISPGEPARFVLEFKRGTAASAGIAPGDLMRHPAISGAPGGGEVPDLDNNAPNQDNAG